MSAMASATSSLSGTYLAGEYTEWSSIQGAMKSGREAAEAVLEDF